MSVMNDSGILAIAFRLQRLSDRIRKEGVQVYKNNGIDFEPKWFPIIYTLHLKGVLGVVELAAEIEFTHPSTISLLKELEKVKLIKSRKDKKDERKRLVRLSEKGKELVGRMEPVWEKIKVAAHGITEGENNLWLALLETEKRMEEKRFSEWAGQQDSGRQDR